MPDPLMMTAYAGLPEYDRQRVAEAVREVARRKRLGLMGRMAVGFSLGFLLTLIPIILQIVQLFFAAREGTVESIWPLAGADIDPDVRAVAEERFS